jgi:hypothetical protein
MTNKPLFQLACHLLLKSALLARRKNFEYLAFHTFGASGKFLVEVRIYASCWTVLYTVACRIQDPVTPKWL